MEEINLQLYDVKTNSSYIISKIELEDIVKHRLEILGMTEGARVFVATRANDAIIIKVRGTKFALGKEFAKGIKVGGAFNV